MRAAFYVRVSTKNQKTDMQEAELREYAAKYGYVGLFYTDIISTRCKDRPARDRLMVDARNGNFESVIVWKLDRFGRSVQDLVQTVGELEQRKISFISLRDNIDFSTPAGRMMFHMLSAVAEFERDLIRERIRAGVHAKMALGGKWGRPPGVGGKKQGSKLYDVAKIEALLNAGKTHSVIALAVGCSKSFVQSTQRRLRQLPAAEEALALPASVSILA